MAGHSALVDQKSYQTLIFRSVVRTDEKVSEVGPTWLRELVMALALGKQAQYWMMKYTEYLVRSVKWFAIDLCSKSEALH